jgi:demethylmenaquinone methyltransferase/2-methoxy-6-polyprenyl-1,4-benzoquinol methylase
MLLPAFFISILGVVVFYLIQIRSPTNKSESVLGSGVMFDTIAPYYDSANKAMSLGYDQSWRQVLVEELNLRADDIILDISTGTGDVAIWIAKKLQTLGKFDGQPITGFDPSSKMLSYAAIKIEELKLAELIQLIEGDAQHMSSLADNYYDKVSMSFGIRNVPDRMKALHEIHRVIRPAGKVIIMEFATPLSGFFSPLARFLVNNFVPAIGGLISGGHTKEYDHLRDSILNFPSPDGFKEMMLKSGFADCISKSIFFDVVHLYICHKKGIEVEAEADSDV